jgi:2-polyprenyl-3-methyl-5-hydroxy-6-metoxy-1,4-benzoquinol methylase
MDIGCASGFITHRLKERLHFKDVHGSDALPEYIENAKKNYPSIDFSVSDLNKQEEAPVQYNLVTCFETLEHVGYLENALNNIYRSIEKNGLALISVPIEVGVIGTIKFLLKVKVYGDKMNEIGKEHEKEYFRTLVKGKDISVYRSKQKDIWWDHFGFNYQTIENYFRQRNIKFRVTTFFTTRFILVYK